MSELNRQFANDLRSLLSQRLGAATMEQVLSSRGEKLLGVMEEPDGRQFVSRVYEFGAESAYEQPRLTFAETLEIMTEMYQDAGIDVVEHTVVPTELTEGQVTVLSEYLADAIPLKEAPLEVKQEAAHGLAKLLDPSIRFRPKADALMPDLFMAKVGDDGNLHPVIVDIDPRIERKSRSGMFRELDISGHISRSQDIIERGLASDEAEVSALAVSFLRALDSSIAEDSSMSVFNSVMSMHALTQRGQF